MPEEQEWEPASRKPLTNNHSSDTPTMGLSCQFNDYVFPQIIYHPSTQSLSRLDTVASGGVAGVVVTI